MDIALGDASLRVSRLQLDVRLRVAGGGLVGQRRVPEIVPGSERLGDAGPLQRGPHALAADLRRIERRAEKRVPEDKRVVALIAALPPLLSQDVRRTRTELDRPTRRSALRRLEPSADERLADGEPSLEQLDVAPPEREQLAAPQGRPERDLHESAREPPPFRILGVFGAEFLVGGEETGDLGLGEHVHLALIDARRLDLVDRVRGHKSPAARRLEHDAEETQVVGDRLRREGHRLLGDVRVDVAGLDSREIEMAEEGVQVATDRQPVVDERRGLEVPPR